jgi:hypothetical protein
MLLQNTQCYYDEPMAASCRALAAYNSTMQEKNKVRERE